MAEATHTPHRNGNGTADVDQPAQDDMVLTDLVLSESTSEGISERSNGGLLSLKDIEVRLDVDYSRLVRLAKSPGIGDYVGAVNTTAKGVRYEPRALEVFRRLIAASDAKELTPATAAAWLKANESKAPTETSPEVHAIAEKPLSGNSNDLATRGLMAVLSPVVSIMQEVRDLLHDFRSGKAQIAPPAAPPQDRLLTADQAAELLACKPRSVGHRVPPVSEGPRRYRESDVLRYIQQLEPKSPK